MSPKFIPPQSSFFYEGVFHADMDNTLLQSILTQKNQMGWTSDEIPEDVLQVARLTVNHYHTTNVTLDKVVNSVNFMQDRYRTYKEASRFKGAIWDYPNNRVTATDKVWKKMFKQYPLARAYRYVGDPQYHNLTILFGANDVKQEPSKTLPRHSSTEAATSDDEGTEKLSDNEEEVNSPVFKSTRKKLFADDTDVADQLSTTNVDPTNVGTAPLGDLIWPARNAFPLKPKVGANKPLLHGGSSSCASSSPSKFNWGPFN